MQDHLYTQNAIVEAEASPANPQKRKLQVQAHDRDTVGVSINTNIMAPHSE